MPETLVERNERWTVAVNLNQNLIGRLIVLAVRTIDSVASLSPNEWHDLHRHIVRTQVALTALSGPISTTTRS